MGILYTDLDWTFDYAVSGVTLFQSEITVHLAVEGSYGSSEIIGWNIDDISIEGWDSKTKRSTRHYLPLDSEGVKLIIASLNADKEFDRAVREHALAEAEAA